MSLARFYSQQRVSIALVITSAFVVQLVGQYLHLSNHNHFMNAHSAMVVESHHGDSHDCVAHTRLAQSGKINAQGRLERGCSHAPSEAKPCPLGQLRNQIPDHPNCDAVCIATESCKLRVRPMSSRRHRLISLYRLAPKQSPPS